MGACFLTLNLSIHLGEAFSATSDSAQTLNSQATRSPTVILCDNYTPPRHPPTSQVRSGGLKSAGTKDSDINAPY